MTRAPSDSIDHRDIGRHSDHTSSSILFNEVVNTLKSDKTSSHSSKSSNTDFLDMGSARELYGNNVGDTKAASIASISHYSSAEKYDTPNRSERKSEQFANKDEATWNPSSADWSQGRWMSVKQLEGWLGKQTPETFQNVEQKSTPIRDPQFRIYDDGYLTDAAFKIKTPRKTRTVEHEHMPNAEESNVDYRKALKELGIK